MSKESQDVTNAVTKEKLENFVRDLNDLTGTVKENDKTYYLVFVSKEEFMLIKRIVYGFAGTVALLAAEAIGKAIFK